ncbi:hypothetical protein LFYK43_14080 [Ligilactobacillus salitolerans]|uniref:Uncharacterized protein n=1 Tax=Ligilactobacillus salitolerans TaxID=1808352 RepID=A0A401ITV1_9LACO|nr:hypothetical protein [Ligilactobacillus salitolerans]GBG94949.1 hypothetical protein LFYK43_14080 [Ligilactobacillus salitolerans]
MMDVCMAALIMFLLVCAEQLDYEWKERRREREHSNGDSSYHPKHFAGGDPNSLDNRTD